MVVPHGPRTSPWESQAFYEPPVKKTSVAASVTPNRTLVFPVHDNNRTGKTMGDPWVAPRPIEDIIKASSGKSVGKLRLG
jgi:hypothetical protein